MNHRLDTTVELLSAEAELLLCCARTHLDGETIARIRALLQAEVDWLHLSEMARQHGVLPLLYQSLRTICPEAVPPSVLARLRADFHANLVRNYYLTAELLELLRLFEAHRIPAIPLKGPALATSLYGDVSFRQFVDLDILVREQDVLTAKGLILSQGYEPKQQLTHTQRTAALHVRRDLGFVRSDGKVYVELHWNLLGWPFALPLSLDTLWQHSHQTLLEGTMVRSLSPEYLLLYLCLHGSRHYWESVGWICDVAEWVRLHQGLDWEMALTQAGMLGSLRRLLLGLCLAHNLLGAPLPENVRKMAEVDPQVEIAARRVHKQLFQDRQRGVWDQFVFERQTMERRRDRVQYCLRHFMLSAWISQALDPPSGRLCSLYQLLERVPSKNVWLWPMPAFALLSWLFHPLLPLKRATKALADWGRGVFVSGK